MISSVVLTKNEESEIQACLKSIKWCDEMIVIDDYSTDRTREIARAMGAKVFLHKLGDNFATQRNFGLDKAKGEWVFFVDADERVSASLRSEIISQILKNSLNCGFFLKRKDFFGKRWLKYGETASVRLLRLGRKGTGKWQRPVHEFWEVRGEVRELKSPLFHYPHQTIESFLERVNFYSTLHTQALFKEGERPSLWRIILKPGVKFCQNWFFRIGFLDGMPGLTVAVMMSFHSFLAQAKLYLKWKK